MNFVSALLMIVGIVLIFGTLLDAFETVVLPRTVSRKFRLTRVYFLASRRLFRIIGKWPAPKLKQAMLVAFAPVSLLVLMIVWAVAIIVGYSILWQALGMPFQGPNPYNFGDRLYFSGTTFLTLGLGDLVPVSGLGRFLAVTEAGTGFGFLALVISYIPVLYAAFARREATILQLDSKAGSNPSAAEMLHRHAEHHCMDQLVILLREWEAFSAQLLENYLSYPMLGFYRSQHDDQSWLTALTAVMDASAFCMECFPQDEPWANRLRFQAKATFSMARHLVVDYSYVLNSEPERGDDRLPDKAFQVIHADLTRLGVPADGSEEAAKRLKTTRKLYEPFVRGLSRRLAMDLPVWCHHTDQLDNWQTSAWDGEHF